MHPALEPEHFVVCYDIRKKRNGYRFHIADPASQNVIYTEQEMKRCWLVTRTEGEEKGTALALEPAPGFYEREDEKEKDGKNSLSFFFFRYLLPYKRQIAHLLLGMLAVSLLQLIFLSLRNHWWMSGFGTGTRALSR